MGGRRWDAGIAIGIVGEEAWEFRAWFQGVGSSRLGPGGGAVVHDGGWDYWDDLHFVFVEMVCICVLFSLDVCCIKRCKHIEPTYQPDLSTSCPLLISTNLEIPIAEDSRTRLWKGTLSRG